MNLWAFILLLTAAILFGIDWARSRWLSLTALGLCLLTVGLIVQWTAIGHTVRF